MTGRNLKWTFKVPFDFEEEEEEEAPPVLGSWIIDACSEMKEPLDSCVSATLSGDTSTSSFLFSSEK